MFREALYNVYCKVKHFKPKETQRENLKLFKNVCPREKTRRNCNNLSFFSLFLQKEQSV